MSLAFLIYKVFPFGGLQRDFLRIMHELSQRGHTCRVYCVSWQGDLPENVEVVLAPSVRGSHVRRNEQVYHWVQSELACESRCGVIGFNKMPGLDVYFAGDTCFLAEAIETRTALYRLGSRFRHFAAWEKAVFERGCATEILLLTARERARFVQHYQTESGRMHLLPPGVSRDRCRTESAQTQRAQTRAELQLRPQTLTLLFVGSDFFRKGLDRAIRSLAKLQHAHPEQDVRLLVAGQDRTYKMDLLARRQRVRGRVEFLGGRKDVPNLLLAADILVHPARSEAAGVVLLEALVAGLPTVATDVCGYASYIDTAVAGKVLPSPFKQTDLDVALSELVDAGAREDCARTALDYSKQADLYSMHEKAADLIEGLLGQKERA
ncbi:MAG: glycosyltransferase family 4 protein [Pseudomonadota bacterium]